MVDNTNNLFQQGLDEIKQLGIRLVQYEDELFWLFEKVYELQPSIYVQIGSFQGACEVILSKACKPHAIIVSIDNGSEGRKGEPRIEALLKTQKHLNSQNFRHFVIEGNSEDPKIIQEYKGLLSGHYPDFVYIDGGHSYDQVGRDLINYPSKNGGIIALHDINSNCNKDIQVYRIWDKIKKPPTLNVPKNKTEECILHKKNGGIGIIYK